MRKEEFPLPVGERVRVRGDRLVMKFILTKELGRLARWLRILGYDAIYYDKDDRSRLVMTALRDKRVILTRSSRMSKFTGIRMLCITEDDVEKQLAQVVKELDLNIEEDKTFLRCVDCNESLAVIKKNEVKDKVPPYVFETQKEFKTCPVCNKIFWKGTHWQLVKEFLKCL
ncbi:MAG: Mut7-C RNAse domain-containing protein [Candidatus Omnitrophota bacterium]|nr:MAG: Mut7-C RNAse domain-containing protein [Candidatus Omnitrophota bacterium]